MSKDKIVKHRLLLNAEDYSKFKECFEITYAPELHKGEAILMSDSIKTIIRTDMTQKIEFKPRKK